MKIIDVLESIESNFTMYHRSHSSRAESILRNGLNINSEQNLTEAGEWAVDVYGCNPVYLSANRNAYTFADSILVRVDVSDLPLVADLPGLVDKGAYVEDGGLYWERGRSPLKREPFVDFESLLDPSTWQCAAAKELSRSAASLHNIPDSRITLLD